MLKNADSNLNQPTSTKFYNINNFFFRVFIITRPRPHHYKEFNIHRYRLLLTRTVVQERIMNKVCITVYIYNICIS